MNKKIKLGAIVFLSTFLMLPILSNDKDNKEITVLIDKAKNAPLSQRIELIMQIKQNIASMNDENRAIAIAEVQKQRKAFISENNMSKAEVKLFTQRIQAYESNLSKDVKK
jgi:hypothetical protein